MPATDAQVKELAACIAAQCQAIADGAVTGDRVATHVSLIVRNVETLRAWVPKLT